MQKATGKADRPLKIIREFRNRREPGITVTVDLLTRGVDVPALENLVFLLRPVKSRILFEQMMGRGIRKCFDVAKTYFTVFDAVGVLEYFRDASDFLSEPPSRPCTHIDLNRNPVSQSISLLEVILTFITFVPTKKKTMFICNVLFRKWD